MSQFRRVFLSSRLTYLSSHRTSPEFINQAFGNGGWNGLWTHLKKYYSKDSNSDDSTKVNLPDKKNASLCPNPENAPSGVDEYDSVQLTPKEQKKLFEFTNVIEENSYYTKYKSKIVNFQRSSPQAFLALVDQLLSSGKKKYDVTPNQSKTLQNRKKLVLDDIMKLSSLMSLDREDICFIWSEYHNSTQMIGAVMNGSKHDSIIKKAETFKSFVFPLPRSDGHEFFLAQYGDDSFYFTPLALYHKYKENSPVCMTLSHFDDLKEKKDLILLRGEFDKDVLNLKEAQFLAVQLNCYYGETNERRLSIMENFNKNSDEFHHLDLIGELATLETEYSEAFPKLK